MSGLIWRLLGVKQVVPPTVEEVLPDDGPSREHLLLLLDLLRERQGAELDEAAKLDGKVSVAMAGATVLLGLVTAALSSVPRGDSAYNWFGASVVFLGGAVILGVGALWPRSAERPPRPETLWHNYYGEDPIETIGRVGSNLAEAAAQNRRLRAWKTRWAKGHLAMLALGVAALLVGIVRLGGWLNGFSAPLWW